MKRMYKDVRLHVNVIPSLEYNLPSAAETVRAAVLGDESREAALQALEQCVRRRDHPRPPPPPPRDADDDPDATDREHEIRRCASRVCTLTKEHLQRLSQDWRRCLRPLHADVRRAVGDVRRELEDARRVQRTYGGKRSSMTTPTLVEREFQKEITRLGTELETRLSRVRERPTPSVSRAPELVEACASLKRVLSESYGHLPTRVILGLKAEFEGEMEQIQEPIGEAFVEMSTRMLSSSSS